MSILLDLLKATEAEPVSAEEELRVSQPSTNLCPYCSSTMTVGEDENLGACHRCWNGE